MVRIITPGNRSGPPARLLQPLTCPLCAAVFALDAADIAPRDAEPTDGKWTFSQNRVSGGGATLDGICPYCHQRLTMRAADLA